MQFSVGIRLLKHARFAIQVPRNCIPSARHFRNVFEEE